MKVKFFSALRKIWISTTSLYALPLAVAIPLQKTLGHPCETITVEIGSRGLPNGLNQLKQLLQMSPKVLEDSLIELTKLAYTHITERGFCGHYGLY